MALDGLLIARAQFAFTIDYHILWPAYSIGISGFIVVLNLLSLGSRQPSIAPFCASGFNSLRWASPWP
jgi:cytochrome d ubiquinol oxidase subunit I